MTKKGVLSDLYRISIPRYVVSFILTAVIGWTSFVFALSVPFGSILYFIATIAATITLFRAVIFIHPIFHLPNPYRRWLRVIYDCFCGVPLLAPFFLYDVCHASH